VSFWAGCKEIRFVCIVVLIELGFEIEDWILKMTGQGFGGRFWDLWL
jgi:hypothetical protein